MKERFYAGLPVLPFFYDWNRRSVASGAPGSTDLAKHPQGLVAEPIVQFLSGVL
jgi:hypothetical protein